MAPFRINGPIKYNKITSFSPLIFSVTYNNSCNIFLPRNVNVHGNSLSSSSFQSSISTRNLYSERHRRISLIAFDAKNSESQGEDNQALDAVMKLYSAFKNKNIHELAEILADECQCVCNFLSFFQAFQGKTQVLEFFSYLISILGNNIQFVVKQTQHNGMYVGVEWKFEWNKIHIPLGKGFSFHMCQSYHGKAVIRNIEMFMEPLIYLEPFKLKITASLTELVEKIGLCNVSGSSENKSKRNLHVLLALSFLTALLFFMGLIHTKPPS